MQKNMLVSGSRNKNASKTQHLQDLNEGLMKLSAAKIERLVLKFGTNSITSGPEICREKVRRIAKEVSCLIHAGKEVTIVTSGAVAMGMEKNKLRKRPIAQSDLQDLAAEGQYSLMKLYEDAFKRYGLGVWQILLTHHNFQTQAEIRNVIERIGNAFRKNKIPILNTNDPVTKEELIPSGSHAFSDNDPLAALVAKHTHSDALIIFSDSGNLGTGGGDSKESAIKKAEEAGVIVLVKSIGDMRSIFREILKSRQLSC